MREEADFESTEAALRYNGQFRAKRGEHFVRFFSEPVKDEAKSAQAGRPIFNDVEFIEIRAPGNNSMVVVSELNDYYKDFFAEQYAHYKKNGEGTQAGTPLSAWPLITKSQIEELKHFNIFTVEQIAEMSDSNAANNMGFRKLRDHAKLFLQAAADLSPMTALQEQLEQKELEIRSQAQLIQKLNDRLETLEMRLTPAPTEE